MDKYYVYRPMLDLLGKSEGTDWNPRRKRGRGYNETLAYGALTAGDVDLVSMTLSQVDALQTKMLRHPGNKWNSSAIGRFQIVRTTLRDIRKVLNLSGALLFDRDMQDRMGCYLLGVRGIDKWLVGRLSTDTLLANLAKEWASLPTPSGKGHYSGQSASVSVGEVKAALAEVRKRHEAGQPKQVERVEVDKHVVPPAVEEEVKKEERRSWWQWLTVVPLTGIATFFRDYPEFAWPAAAGVVAVAVVAIVGGRRLVRRVKGIVEEVRG